ncbi:MAG: hypothetical protein LBR97_04090 [Dysgonamonadaceae bacterium]|jgi:hypothetical protein|nr:hypothetical protein [Dysgonamonadaceae bacterium]
MLRNRKNLLTTKILESIPKNIKSIEYLIKILGISKESAYRRLRGKIPFTFEEMSKLSLDLNFSMDELIARNDESRVLISMQTAVDKNPSDVFLKKFEQYSHFLLHLENYSNVESIMVMNHVPIIASIYFKDLFKFFYFKWLHQNQETSLKLNYSDVVIPAEIEELRKRVKFNTVNFAGKITLIIDSNFFISLMDEIRYYHKRRLISDEEFENLKNDISGSVDFLENCAQTGIFGRGAEMDIYLSSMNIDANSIYVKHNGKETSFFYAFSINPINVGNDVICGKHKKWILSVKKYSMLITRSNEILQTEYFDNQREFINSRFSNPLKILESSAQNSLRNGYPYR